MATRNRNGRNLVSYSPSASATAYARGLAILAAKAAGKATNQMIDMITSCGSVKAIQTLRAGHKF